MMCVCVCVCVCHSRLLDWRERRADGPMKKKSDRIVIFKGLFNPKEFEVSL